jgi:hypothetical protein
MPTQPIHAPRLPQLPTRARIEWGSLLELAPSSFDLLSTRSLARQGLDLLSNAANARRFLSVLTAQQSHLRAGSIPVLVKEYRNGPELVPHAELSRSQRRWIGQLALELYFTQIFRSEVAVIDLWPSRFGVDSEGEALWAPRPFYLRWDPTFREGIRNIYAGFFLDDQPRFELGVRQLGLGSGARALLDHFGDGNQRSVRFGVEKLRDTLDAMSDARDGRSGQLHPNFAAFGLYLVALHELLGSLDMAYDVRAAFMRTYPGDTSKR